MLGTTDPWVILGLEPCGDYRRVRRAYAAKLKESHPEDDPAGFMRLRKAYESLRESLNCPDGLELPLMESSEATAATEPEPTSVPKRPVRERAEPLAPEWEVPETIGRLMHRVRTICRDDRLWGSLDAWRSVLDDAALWRVDIRPEFAKTLFEFLAARKKGPGWAVWSLLEQEFHWRDRGLYVPIDFGFDSVSAPVERINMAARSKFRPPRPVQDPFTLTESWDLTLDDGIPFLGVWVHYFGWFALAATLLASWFG